VTPIDGGSLLSFRAELDDSEVVTAMLLSASCPHPRLLHVIAS
jgi:hypothetical protein